MALVFNRVAQNHLRAGYYPTDEVTLSRILDALECEGTTARILDPCCGEGAALASVESHLAQVFGAEVTSLGVEFDPERAWAAKRLLSRCIHADVHDVVISPRSVGLLFLNPPYGFGVSDQVGRAGQGEHDKAERLERQFLHLCTPMLAYGGVMVFIVPHYAVDADMAAYIGRHFRDVRAFMAPEQQFKQCVIFGVHGRPRNPPKELLQDLQALREGEWLGSSVHELPEVWSGMHYSVPDLPADPEHRFHAVRLDARQLDAEVTRLANATLWPAFEMHFSQADRSARRPLRDMSHWHLALALAAGQVTGTVVSPAGRTLLIKGDTFKKKHREQVTEVDEDGKASSTLTLTDTFVPVIRAIDFTPGPNLGDIVTIR